MTLWSPPGYLEQCRRLAELGIRPRFKIGERLARGFADLGVEEFCVLPGQKLLSLMAGAVTSIVAEHEHFFFRVPNVDELIEELMMRGAESLDLTYVDRRLWQVRLTVEGNRASHEAATVQAVLATALESLLQG